MTPLDALRERVLTANCDLVRHGLVLFTWGNASAVDRDAGVMVIKPSGVDYQHLRPEHLVAIRLADGAVIPAAAGQATLAPSSDTPTHLELYRAWPSIGGIVHTHSEYATSVAQAGLPIPALGTTHADYFAGDIPCTRPLTAQEIEDGYEVSTGAVIIERFAADRLDPLSIPGALISQHAPFAWGATVEKARMLVHTRTLAPTAISVPRYLLDKHYQRKHGPAAYYGQKRP